MDIVSPSDNPNPQNNGSNMHEGVAHSHTAEDDLAPDQTYTDDGQDIEPHQLPEILIPKALREQMPKVHDGVLELFELSQTTSIHRPTIKGPKTLVTEQGSDFPIKYLEARTSAATIAAGMDARLPIISTKSPNGVDRYSIEVDKDAVINVQKSLATMYSGWPKKLVDILLSDPKTGGIDSDGLELLCERYGLQWKARESGVVVVEIDDPGTKISREYFDKPIVDAIREDGVARELKSNSLKRRMENGYRMLTPQTP